MNISRTLHPENFDLAFKVYYELMANRVSEILLVSSPYDAFIMEEDGRLAERIIHEYRGLNLTRPPRLTWVSNAQQAFKALSHNKFDIVITMPRLDDMDVYGFGRKVKEHFNDIPVFLLTHYGISLSSAEKYADKSAIDQIFVWSGNTDLLLALIKNLEDRMNVDYDTKRAQVRVIILVEDFPKYYSSFLPILYKEIVTQTNAVMEESLNDEHRILRMRARPKVLFADNYEDAEHLYRRFKPYVLTVFSDVRFPRNGKLDRNAGVSLLSMIRKESNDLPLLMLSSEEDNREKAEIIPAVFINKNSPTLNEEIRSFFVDYLGFGDFIFRLPDGKEVGRAQNIHSMEKILHMIPEESIRYHAKRNHFSSWLMARSEIQLALKLRPVKVSDFADTTQIRNYLINCLRERRKGRQRGIIADFTVYDFDPDTDFVKLGKGSLGGKARGLAFMSTLLRQTPELQQKYYEVTISVPKTFVISTEGFDSFVNENNLKELITCPCSDAWILELFIQSMFPEWLRQHLEIYLSLVKYPLAVRSSSLLEDAMFQSRAGIYNTYMLPNNNSNPRVRLNQLINAIKMVYASTFMEKPRTFAKSTMSRTEEEKMAVIIQQLTGTHQGDYFYPAISGVAQSYNYYPVAYMKPEEGIVHMALGLGKIVVEGGAALRFSPKYPQFLPHFSKVEDILKNSQQHFYALNTAYFPANFEPAEDATLVKVPIDEAEDHFSVKALSSTYVPEDNRIRDTTAIPGYRVLTFAPILKHGLFPLPSIISDLLELGRKGMGCPVEMEFAVNIYPDKDHKPEFSLLQVRPMAYSHQDSDVEIDAKDIQSALCYSNSALGNGKQTDIQDIVFVKRDAFDPAKTIEQAKEIDEINKILVRHERKYLLIGPGRWGSADRWLGIPVTWNDISGVGAMIEASFEQLKADPSQGSHFFNNITSLGISYLTVADNEKDFIRWDLLESLTPRDETRHLKHVTLEKPLTIKIDGKSSRGVILP